MPFSFYHGRTGVVFNVTKGSIGIEVNKVVNGRQLKKRMHVRAEHLQKSRCHEAHLERVRVNDAVRREANARGEKVNTKRTPPGQPKLGYIVRARKVAVEVLEPLTYVENYH